VWLKLEGLEPGGQVTDRFVEDAIQAALHRHAPTRSDTLVVRGATPFALSVAQWGVTAGFTVWVYHHDVAHARRLRPLLTELGARVKHVALDTTLDAAIGADLAGSAVEVDPSRVTDTPGRALGAELLRQLSASPRAVILSPEAAPLAAGLRTRIDAPVVVVDSVDGHEPDLHRVRASLGRQGILVGPSGAAVVARARNTVVGGPVVAVLPDGGHRHLGWWPDPP